MSHEMYNNDSAIYRHQAAWHGLGKVIQEDVTPTRALKMGGLDWRVVLSEGLEFTYFDEMNTVKGFTNDRVAVVRTDTNEALGIVSNDYKPVQNIEMAEVAEAIAGKDTVVETMGSLRNGRRVYCTVRLDELQAMHDDIVNTYMLLTMSHDGTLSFTAMPTSVRVVCNNTLTMALNQASKNVYKFRHKGDIAEKILEAKEAMEFYAQTGKLFKKAMNTLVTSEVNGKKQVAEFFTNIYEKLNGKIPMNPQNEKEQDQLVKAQKSIVTWWNTMNSEMNQLNVVTPNKWLLANAVTKDLQHSESNKGRKTSDSARFEKNVLGKVGAETIKVVNSALATC